jgi:hypothetical protein
MPSKPLTPEPLAAKEIPMMLVKIDAIDALKNALQVRADAAKGFVATYAAKLIENPDGALYEMSWRHGDAMQQQSRYAMAREILTRVEAMEARGNDLDAILAAIRWDLSMNVMNAARDTSSSSNSSSNEVHRRKLAEMADLYADLFGHEEPPVLK